MTQSSTEEDPVEVVNSRMGNDFERLHFRWSGLPAAPPVVRTR
jgi:hypothetical protein